MPKGKKKDKTSRGKAVNEIANEEDVTDCDSVSVVSTQSDGSTVLGGVEGGEDVDETSAQEDFEEKLKEVIDGLTQKSAKGRVECLRSLKTALSKKFIYEFIFNRKMTVGDGLEKCVRKGKGEEVHLAAHCFVLLILQLGAGGDSEELLKTFSPFLNQVMADTSASLKGRKGCAEALGMGAFIAAEEISDVVDTMQNLEKIFKASYLKGDGVAPTHSPEVAALHASALMSWAVLLSIAPPHTVDNYVKSHLLKLSQLLQSSDVDLRIAAGEVIALLYELARVQDEDFKGPKMTEMCDKLKELATDSNKFRAKKDRRVQRSSFRDILRTVEEWEYPETNLKFGSENLYLDGWARKRQYDALCHIVGTGMNTHLQENELIRDIFDLGSVVVGGAPVKTKGSKAERQYYNAAAFKARTKARSKFRDKRSTVVGGDS